jgi:homoserine/homoserine lactone efflux protein
MDLEAWSVYVLAAIGLSLTPGPNGLLALSHGLRFGIGRASYTAVGGVVGFLVLVAVSLAGLGVLLATSERAFTVAKGIGAAYLVYLGLRTWRATPPTVRRAHAGTQDPHAAPQADPERTAPASPQRCFMEGFLVAVTNPKALIFFAAFLPQFMQPGLGFWTQLLVLGGTFAVVELAYELAIAGAAQRVAPWLGRHGRLFNRITGATFVLIGAALAATRR